MMVLQSEAQQLVRCLLDYSCFQHENFDVRWLSDFKLVSSSVALLDNIVVCFSAPALQERNQTKPMWGRKERFCLMVLKKICSLFLKSYYK